MVLVENKKNQAELHRGQSQNVLIGGAVVGNVGAFSGGGVGVIEHIVQLLRMVFGLQI